MKTLIAAVALAFALTAAAPISTYVATDAAAAKAKKPKKAKKAAKKKSCGTYMYMKKGKCMDARAKK